MSIRLNGSTSGYVEIDAPAVAGSTSITLPATSGGEVVVTDSSGNVNIDSGTLYVDAVNNRVGVGTASPNNKFTLQDGSVLVRSEVTTGTSNSNHIGFSATSSGGIAATISSYRENANEASALTFNTWNGSAFGERARIDSSGSLLVNHTEAGSKGATSPLQVKSSSDANCITLKCRENSNDYAFITFTDNDASEGLAEIYVLRTGASSGALIFGTNNGNANSTERMRLNSNGYLYCNGVYNAPVGGTTKDVYVENNGNIGYLSSIKASKTNISNLDETDWLWSLSPKSFNYRIKDEHGNWTDEAHPELQYGLIAEEVEQVAPGICSYDVDEEGNKKLVAVQYSKLVTPLLKALQQANERIETLEAINASFEARLTALEGGQP